MRVTVRRTRTARQVPWWLDRGTEVCVLCWQPYVFGLARSCVACSQTLCPACAGAVETHIVVCHDCADAPDD
jgi:hypothetical protein